MTPRELLIAALEIGLEHTQSVLSRHEVDLGRTTHSNKAEAETVEDELKQIQDAIKLVKQIAIGRWVPVEGRLPENGARCVVRGHDNKLFWADHFCNGIWDKYEYEPTVTHWLDLSLPSGKGEA